MEEEMYFTDIAQIKTINALLRVDTRRDRIEDLDLVVLYNTDSLNRQLCPGLLTYLFELSLSTVILRVI